VLGGKDPDLRLSIHRVRLAVPQKRRLPGNVHPVAETEQQFGVDPKKLRSRREIGIPIALWELCGKRLCLGFVVELLNCGTLCTEVDEEFREPFSGEPLK
jgi:hypothetical protein